MLEGQRILVTGVTGKAVLPISAALARSNEVWGQARFEDPSVRNAVEAHNIRTCSADLASGDLSGLPEKIDYLLHFAWMRGGRDDLSQAMTVNVEGAGLVLHHCRSAKAALVVSSTAIYSGKEDPWHRYVETDVIGPSATCTAATSPISKAGLESMARFAARAYSLPVTIARLNTVMGPHKAFFGKFLDAVREEREIILPGNPDTHSPIHSEDMIRQIAPLLDAAALSPITVNWCGDEVVISQDAINRMAARVGVASRITARPSAGLAGGNISDAGKRRALTGTCLTKFSNALERMMDEMLDGAPCPLAQRDWGYRSSAQIVSFNGAQ